jgi:hypothetical protein
MPISEAAGYLFCRNRTGVDPTWQRAAARGQNVHAMRGRPKLKLLLTPRAVVPGARLRTETVLTARAATPVKHVSIRLRATVRTTVGAGHAQAIHEHVFHERAWLSKPLTLHPGELRVPVEFEIPPDAPASYVSPMASVAYTLSVHVAIPWWLDRRADFLVPVTNPVAAAAPDPAPRAFATSTEGPRGTDAFMEVALDATQLAAGAAVGGSVSLQNLGGRNVRGVDLSFIEIETVSLPRHEVREARRFTLRVHDGRPLEGSALRFRVRLPDAATPTFTLGAATRPLLQVRTFVELRADVAWGDDIVVRAPLLVAPKGSAAAPAGRGWVAPVGRERQTLVWREVATKLGLAPDADAQRMTGQRAGVTIEIGAEHRDDDYWLTASLGWPDLGLDLDVAERSWTDALALDVLRSGDPRIDRRLRAHAREHAQARAIVTPDVLAAVMAFDEVALDDRGGRLALRGAAHVAAKLEAFIGGVLVAADTLARGIARIPAPAMFSDDLIAWEAAAARLRGRLELGRMWVHDGRIGVDAVEVGNVWARDGAHLGGLLRVTIDPPLEQPPASLADPALSPAARDLWRELAARTRSVRVGAAAIDLELEGKLADPQTATPLLDLAIALRRALGGVLAAGPFR